MHPFLKIEIHFSRSSFLKTHIAWRRIYLNQFLCEFCNIRASLFLSLLFRSICIIIPFNFVSTLASSSVDFKGLYSGSTNHTEENLLVRYHPSLSISPQNRQVTDVNAYHCQKARSELFLQLSVVGFFFGLLLRTAILSPKLPIERSYLLIYVRAAASSILLFGKS